MTDIRDLSAFLKWKLLVGGHKFPGPDGGTCITEAAIVVAGFEYRTINSASDCPPCFSRPISIYAIKLNDRMPDDLRQELLMPFVTRLTGTADSAEIECERADMIVIRTVSDILPIVLRLHRLEAHAVPCERARTRAEAYAAANKARYALRSGADAAYSASAAAAAADATYAAYASYASAASAAAAAAAAADATYAAYASDASAASAAAADAAYAASASASAAARRQIWTKAAHILDSALRIGNRAQPIETSIIVARANAAKQIEPT